jgi:hypothetical protein
MTFYSKRPQAALDYVIDWGGSLKGRVVATSDWSIHPVEPGGVAVQATAIGPTATCATLTGGVPGRRYSISGRATFADGGVATRGLAVLVSDGAEVRR